MKLKMMATSSAVFAFVLLLLHFSVVNMSMAAILNITTDQSSLLALKNHITHDPNDILAKNWSSNAPVCSWIGVTCSSSHLRITGLNLSHMDLVGTIPPHIGNLSFLVTLSFKNNRFHGSLPIEMAQLRRMKILSLGFNNFTGEIPSWFVLLPKLEWLFLPYNIFTGTIPSSLFNINSLQTLHLGGNKLRGFIPSNFFMAPALQIVSIANNQISGSIPSNILSNSSLQVISFSYNNLSSELPENIFNQLPQLTELYLANNQFSGKLPLSLFNCNKLQILQLSSNKFTGRIPHEIGNLTMLQLASLGANNFYPGGLPHGIGNIHHLQMLGFSNCNLRGNISSIIFNISTIRIIDLDTNYLWGSLPSNLGFPLPNLEELYLGNNYISGKIPSFLFNITMLAYLDLGQNFFSGYIPNIFSNLRKLKKLHLHRNNLTNDPSNPELGIINSLANCKVLKEVRLFFNPLNSSLPIAIGNLSNSLEVFEVDGSNMWGSIPTSIGNLSGPIELGLSENQLSGTIPTEIWNLKDLQDFVVEDNKLDGLLPHELCKLKRVAYLTLDHNNFFGPITSCVGNITSLSQLWLGSNTFNSIIPSSLWGLSNLLVLDLSSNKLKGPLSLDIGNLKVLIGLNLSGNQLSGNIPSTIGQLQDLAELSLAQNRFKGSIPVSFGNMISLEVLNLSRNNLSGVVPNSLEALVYLESFDVSFNKLEGEVPSKGPFKNFSAQSYMGNVGLCGGVPRLKLPNCKATTVSKPSITNAIVLKCVLPIVIAMIFLPTLAYVLIRCQKQTMQSISDTNTTITIWRRISYHELQQATDGFSDINLLGIGSFGKVYKGILSNGMNIAVKVFNLELEGAFKSFDVECEILCNIRHQNLVKIISSCANIDFKALVLSYMPNGNLEKWLHSHNHCLSIIQRLNIMIDVATALEYLHHECSTPIVHCDLKPNNVLLDENMVGHLTDFGIGKLLNGGNSIRQTMTLATIGYMAPEYGLEGFVSRQCDVYSYGILLMETFTQKTPTDDMFQEEFNIKHWVEESYPSAIIDIVDVKLLMEDGVQFSRKRDCLASIMGLALECSAELPKERKYIKDVLVALQKIKKRFLNEAGVSRPTI